jgi:hypothetical protein
MAEKKQAEMKTGKPEPAKGKEKVEAKKAETTNEQEKDKSGTEEEQEESYLKDLMAISGHGGLFKFVSQGRNGIIVEHLETGKRMQAFATMKVSALEDIAVYTEEEEIQLAEVFSTIHKYEKGKEAISPKSDGDDLKDYFGAILPEYDRERVYVSDIKKILGWYNMLLKYDLLEIDKPAKKSPAIKDSEAEDKNAEPKPADK